MWRAFHRATHRRACASRARASPRPSRSRCDATRYTRAPGVRAWSDASHAPTAAMSVRGVEAPPSAGSLQWALELAAAAAGAPAGAAPPPAAFHTTTASERSDRKCACVA